MISKKASVLFLFIISTFCFYCNVDSTLQEKDIDSNKSEITDVDGNIYNTIKIGDQWWMVENLRVSRFQNGDTIANVDEDSLWQDLKTGAMCFYDKLDWQTETYGVLYNFYAVIDTRGLAPEGWHVPTDEDWKELEMFLGMSKSAADSTGYRGIDTGGKLKEEGTKHWRAPNIGATNSSEFTALPAGIRSHAVHFYFDVI